MRIKNKVVKKLRELDAPIKETKRKTTKINSTVYTHKKHSQLTPLTHNVINRLFKVSFFLLFYLCLKQYLFGMDVAGLRKFD